MTDKELLIQLIYESDISCNSTLCNECDYASTPRCKATMTAEHILTSGVTFATENNVGHWIIHSSGKGSNATNWAECSECHVCGSPQWKVCPVCETRMENHSAINIEEVDFDYSAED